MTFGGSEGLYEMNCKDPSGDFYYDFPFNGDVEGFLTEDLVSDLMIKIQTLEWENKL